MNPMTNTVMSVNQSSYVQQSRQSNQMEFSNVKNQRSFIDNKPMIQGLVRSVLKVQKNGQAHLINTGLTDVEGAKQIAQNLFGFYDKDNSRSIDTVKAMPMLTNAYRVLNSNFNPQKEDINSFFQTLDTDGNGKVTIEDLQALCVRYLTGSTLGVSYKFHQKSSMGNSQQSRPY